MKNKTSARTQRHQLFHARSVLKRLPRDGAVLHDVVVHWIRVGKGASERPYNALIADYKRLDDLRRPLAEHAVEELFTPTQAKQLGTYLDLSDGDIFDLSEIAEEKFIVERASLPVTGAVTGYRDMPVGGLAGRFALSGHQGYDLPFEVYGYFDLAMSNHRYDLDENVAYVHRALQSLGLDRGVKKQQIEEVVEKLYRRDRLFVTSEKNRKDWLGRIEM